MDAFESSSVEQSDVGSRFYEPNSTNKFSTEPPGKTFTIDNKSRFLT